MNKYIRILMYQRALLYITFLGNAQTTNPSIDIASIIVTFFSKDTFSQEMAGRKMSNGSFNINVSHIS